MRGAWRHPPRRGQRHHRRPTAPGAGPRSVGLRATERLRRGSTYQKTIRWRAGNHWALRIDVPMPEPDHGRAGIGSRTTDLVRDAINLAILTDYREGVKDYPAPMVSK